ncbi:Pleckstrin homology domain containing protein [Oryctes borbonicus]|uniref:Pleckstrin homology domain containing protein n=1 Tax=Oryctes borbonicus TaxID=1629725 RepID=A0A0T6AWM8_9SCAR|nr:Pleckstrin homology domain containing protein [Oryctes borbonicus]
MENKKVIQTNTTNNISNDSHLNDSILKHAHQHNTTPQHLRLLQYGLKVPSQQHQHSQISPSHQHQVNSPSGYLHVHQHQQQPIYQSTHKYPQKYNTPATHVYHQHQQKLHQHSGQQLYHINQPPPPPQAHSHTSLGQQNAQIWVPPHQPPVHYHQPKAEAQPQTQVFSQTQISKSKEVVERKKASGNVSQLRSPIAKRPAEAPVTMQGWLHKQGSDGLMLWKKRWFVLSEYCLFYYKGPEEEKLLGSILLPSYKVSICGPEDKTNRKYAFKCEHTNMRTYILAADSQELMIQWVRVLNLACLLQTTMDLDQSVQSTSTYINSGDNSDSGFYQQYNQSQQTIRNTPVHTHTSSNTTDISQELNQYNQPLYANAPPKPRRLNDAGYSSPSPDVLDRYHNESKYINPQHIFVSQSPHPRSLAKSPVSLYNPNQQHQQEYIPHMNQVNNKNMGDYGVREYNTVQNVERRTPDTYGRSKSNPSKGRTPSDYEDIYSDQCMYKRPLSPLAYNNVKKTNPVITPIQRTYTPVSMLGPRDMMQYVPLQMRKSPSNIPRPHSADFLEYEVNHRQNNSCIANRQPRPKSSLDINRNASNDNYFYTEERYAEKMRKSTQYLPKMPQKYPQQQQQTPKSQPPDLDKTFPLMKSSTQPINFVSTPIEYQRTEPQPTRSRSVLSEGSLSKELEVDLRSSPHGRYESPWPGSPQELTCGYVLDDPRRRESEQFIRSASARLSQSGQNERISIDGRMSREGEKKREESMKRLLEWKQRMLQSPLNRKVHQSLNKTYPGKLEVYYKHPENGYRPNVQHMVDQYGDGRATCPMPQYTSYSSDDEASGSICINNRDSFPRAISARRIWTPTQQMQSRSSINLSREHENEYSISDRKIYYSRQGISHHDISSNFMQSNTSRKGNWQWGGRMNVSAGELLGRTHEELVLLLIQLRRQSTNTYNAIEACYNEIDTIQAQLHLLDASKQLENLQKLEQIKQHLIELEKQYEKGKPLVNLVDNMVKLGSLYRGPNDRNVNPYVRDRLEFNQQIQERRLLAEERRDWNRLNPNHTQLQEKVQQLYQLDRLIQEESGTLQGLQHDKEEIERALGGLRHRLNKGYNDPAEVEQARKQQAILENELSRVHLMLAQNSKKLEETVAGNARLEQELLVLKQKLQISRQQRCSPQFSNAGDSLPCVVGTSAMLESDLQRVQQKVGDLQRQRQELSIQVRQLTDRSNNLQQQIKPFSANSAANNQGNKKKMHLLWRETDLDTMNIVDHGAPTTPLYINTDLKQNPDSDFYNRLKSSDSTSEEAMHSANFLPQERAEIKTVRIVKRESERRQRDREKTSTGKWDPLFEEDTTSSQSSSILFRPTPIQKTQSTTNLGALSPSFETDKTSSGVLSRQSSLSSPSLPQGFSDVRTISSEGSVDKSPELSPVFKSEAARQIITEMTNQEVPKQLNRRSVPKEKRRHYTAPNNNLIMKSFHQLPADDAAFDKLNARRARDDLDMERALRQRIDAPDVVRSTLSSKELKYNENTIDNILGTPNKINIPERYIPEQLPQLSAEEQEHRLRKVESIKKMLSDTTIISSSSPNLASGIVEPNCNLIYFQFKLCR